MALAASGVHSKGAAPQTDTNSCLQTFLSKKGTCITIIAVAILGIGAMVVLAVPGVHIIPSWKISLGVSLGLAFVIIPGAIYLQTRASAAVSLSKREASIAASIVKLQSSLANSVAKRDASIASIEALQTASITRRKAMDDAIKANREALLKVIPPDSSSSVATTQVERLRRKGG